LRMLIHPHTLRTPHLRSEEEGGLSLQAATTEAIGDDGMLQRKKSSFHNIWESQDQNYRSPSRQHARKESGKSRSATMAAGAHPGDMPITLLGAAFRGGTVSEEAVVRSPESSVAGEEPPSLVIVAGFQTAATGADSPQGQDAPGPDACDKEAQTGYIDASSTQQQREAEASSRSLLEQTNQGAELQPSAPPCCSRKVLVM